MKMTKLVLLFLLIVCTISAQSAQDLSLWEISGKENKVYLMGSIHLLRKSDYPLDSAYYRAFNRSKKAVFEVDVDSAKSFAFQMYMLSKAKLPAGKTLKQVVSPAVYKKCDEVARSLGSSASLLNGFTPSFVALTISMLKIQQLGFNPMLGIEYHFHPRAKSAGKTVVGLESAKFQIDLLSSLDSMEGDFLAATLKDIESYDRDLNSLLRCWKSGEVDELDSLMNAALRQYPELKEKLLLERNRNWVKPLVAMLQESEDVFVVVGAGHIGGKDGILSLLKKEGYNFRQCTSDFGK